MEILDRSVDIGPFIPESDDDVIVCRCEEITKGEIRKAVHLGCWNVTEVKRHVRACAGMCQGQTCQKQVRAIIARELHKKPEEIQEMTARPPMRPITIENLLREADKL